MSSQVRRDEAAISDRNDERTRERYTISVSADIDPENVVKRWYLNDYDFGTKYLRQLVIRWANLGRAGHGPARQIAGDQVQAPLFRVCEGCGVLDRAAGDQPAGGAPRLVPVPQGPRRARPEHRPWPDPDDAGGSDPAAAVGHDRRPVRRPQPGRRAAARPARADRRQPRPHRHRGDQRAHRARRPGQRGAAAARHRARRHRLPRRTRQPGADVGPAAPGVGEGPRLPLPARAAARLPPVPRPVRPDLGRRTQPGLPVGRGTAPARDPDLRRRRTRRRPTR